MTVDWEEVDADCNNDYDNYYGDDDSHCVYHLANSGIIIYKVI